MKEGNGNRNCVWQKVKEGKRVSEREKEKGKRRTRESDEGLRVEKTEER